MARTRQLTERQKKFAELLIWNNDELSPSQCAEQAGYKTRARQSASELRNPRLYPQVVEYIRELHQERMEKYKVTKDTHIKRLADIGKRAETKNQFSAAITAEHYRGKVAGLYVDKSLVMTGSIDRMDKSTLLKELEKYKMKYAVKDESSPSLESHQEEKHFDQKIPHHPDHTI